MHPVPASVSVYLPACLPASLCLCLSVSFSLSLCLCLSLSLSGGEQISEVLFCVGYMYATQTHPATNSLKVQLH